MRIAGAILLILACGGFGIYSAHSLSARAKALENAINYILRIYEEMRLSGDELPAILLRTQSPVYIKNGSWHGTEKLKRADMEILASFIKSLGKTDLEGQQKNALLHIESLRRNLEEAEKEKAERSKLYISLSFLGGLFVAILLI